ncbi:MAG: hypothetical protein PUC23_03615 [bacterium]|nr:hypothetical protein [bacterium]
METVLKFDRVILTKELNEKFKKVGEVFEIANILDDSFLLRDSKTKVAVGVIKFEDFDEYFVKENEFEGWTKWMPLTGFDGQTDCLYRTNRRKTQVKFITDKVRGESCCNRNDEFNLYIGIQLAYLRCLNKAFEQKKVQEELKLTTIEKEISYNNQIIKKILNSLNT